MSPNSALRLRWYCKSADLTDSRSVSRGRILRPTLFSTKPIAPKSSVSSIATSSVFSLFLNATMLWLRAIGSGMSDNTSYSIFCPLRLINGIPRIYASAFRKSSSESLPWSAIALARVMLCSFDLFSASSKSFRDRSPESKRNVFICSWSMCMC